VALAPPRWFIPPPSPPFFFEARELRLGISPNRHRHPPSKGRCARAGLWPEAYGFFLPSFSWPTNLLRTY